MRRRPNLAAERRDVHLRPGLQRPGRPGPRPLALLRGRRGWRLERHQFLHPGPRRPQTAAPAPQPTQVIVKIDLAQGYSIGDITAAFPVKVNKGGLASRGIYLVTPTLPRSLWPPGELAQLAGQINGSKAVL